MSHPYAKFLLLCAIVGGSAAFPGQVIEVNEAAEEAVVSVDALSPWKAGNQVCILHDKSQTACGPLIEINGTQAKMKLEVVTGAMVKGDEVQAVDGAGAVAGGDTSDTGTPEDAEETGQSQGNGVELTPEAPADKPATDSPKNTKKDGESEAPEEDSDSAAKAIDESNNRVEIMHYHRDLIRGQHATGNGVVENSSDSLSEVKRYDVTAALQFVQANNHVLLSPYLDVDALLNDHWSMGIELDALLSNSSSFTYYGGLATVKYFFTKAGTGIHFLLGVGAGDLIPQGTQTGAAAFNAKAALGGQWRIAGGLHLGFQIGAQIFLYSSVASVSGTSANVTTSTVVPCGALHLGFLF